MPIDSTFNTANPEAEDLYSQMVDSTVPDEKESNSVAHDNRQAGLAALIDAELDEDGDPTQKFPRRKFETESDPSHESIRSSVVDKVLKDVDESMDTIVQNSFTTEEPKQIQDTITGTAKMRDELAAKRSTMSIEEAYIETFSTSFDERQRQNEQFRLQVFSDIQNLFSDATLTDKIVDYSGLLLSDATLDWSRVVGDGYLTTPESVAEFLDNWTAMPVEAKQRLYPELKQAIYEATDKNNVKTAMKLLSLLDPKAHEEVLLDLRADQFFLGFDVATLGGAMVLKIAKALKVGANLTKAASTVGRADKAAELSMTSLADESGEAAKIIGTGREAAQSNGVGFKMEDILPDATDGIAPDVQKLIKEVELGRDEVRQKMHDVMTGEAFLHEGAFTELAKERVQQAAIDDLMKLRDDVIEAQDWAISDIKIANKTDDGFTLEYSYEGVPVTQRHEYKISDVGTFDQMETGSLESKLASPSYHLAGIDERMVEGATNIELGKAKILDQFNRTVDDITRTTIGNPLFNVRKYRQLDDVMLAGDDFPNADGTFGKVFQIDELRYGVDTKNGTIRLDDKQIKAYYKLRDLFDHAWYLKNKELRNTLRLNGFKDIHFEGTKAIGRAFERLTEGSRSMSRQGVSVIYDPKANKGLGKVVHADDVPMSERYEQGYRIVRFQDKEVVHGNHISFALVKEENVAELPQHVMHYKKGYVPKIYPEGHYFVKQELRGVVNSQANGLVGLKTVRVFNNKKEAEAFAESLRATDETTKFRVLHDRELSDSQLADEAVGLSGGLYTSPRATHPLVFGTDGLPPQRMGAFQALQQNLHHLSNYLARNEWRIGMQQKWINTAREMGMIKIDDFNAHLQGERHSKAWESLNAAREYIRDQIRIPTSEERWFEQKSRALADWAMNSPLPEKAKKTLNNSLLNLSTTDPFALFRSVSFHSLLGWFNPAQLFVQAQGSTIAMSIYPQKAPRAIQEYMALRPLMYAGKSSPKAIDQVAERLAKATGQRKEDLLETYQLWKKTGLEESIKATADHAAAKQNFSIGSIALSKAMDKGLVFYREGELFSRGISFSIAKQAWKERNAGKSIGDLELKEILDDALKLQLNLTRANRAAWQKGALSVPTQFLQIQTKFLEKVMGKQAKGGFTPQQKTRLLMGQFILYGTAGVPLTGWLMNEAMNFTGQTPEEMSPELKAYMDGGIFDLAFYQAFDVQAEFGRRGAIVSGIEQFIHDAIYKEAPLAEKMFGAFGSTAARAYNSWKNLKPLAKSATEITWTADEFKLIAGEVGKVISTWRNIDKAIWMSRYGTVVDKNNRLVVDRTLDGGFNWAEIIAQGAGFSLKEVQDVYSLDQYNKEWDAHIRTRSDALVNLQYNYLNNVDNEGAARNYEVMAEVLLGDLNPYEQGRVMELVGRRISDPRSKEEKVIAKYYKDVAENTMSNNIFWSPNYTNTVIPSNEAGE